MVQEKMCTIFYHRLWEPGEAEIAFLVLAHRNSILVAIFFLYILFQTLGLEKVPKRFGVFPTPVYYRWAEESITFSQNIILLPSLNITIFMFSPLLNFD